MRKRKTKREKLQEFLNEVVALSNKYGFVLEADGGITVRDSSNDRTLAEGLLLLESELEW